MLHTHYISFTRHALHGSHCTCSTGRASSPIASSPCGRLSTAHHIWPAFSPSAYRKWRPTHRHDASHPRLLSPRYCDIIVTPSLIRTSKKQSKFSVITHLLRLLKPIFQKPSRGLNDRSLSFPPVNKAPFNRSSTKLQKGPSLDAGRYRRL